MLQTPINVTPSNGEVIHLNKSQSSQGVYTNPPLFAYTFQGDRLSYAVCEMYDLDTWDYSTGYYSRFVDSIDEGWASTNYVITDVFNGTYHRNTPVPFHYTGYNIVEGHNYQYRYKFYQCYPQSMTQLADKPLVDIYYGRGKIYPFPSGGGSVTQHDIYIETDLTNIEQPWIKDDQLRGGIWFEVNGQRALIQDYNPQDGHLTLASNITFPTGGYNTLVGTPYKLFTNYIVTPWYDFKYRAAPAVSFSTSGVKGGISIDGTYAQTNAVGIKWYQYEIYTTTISAYSTTRNYFVGNVVVYNNALYKCTTATSGTWDSSAWTTISIVDDPSYGILVDSGDRSFSSPDKDDYPANPHANSFHLNRYEHAYVIRMTATTQEDDFTYTETYLPKLISSVSDDIVTAVTVNGENITRGGSLISYEYKNIISWMATTDYEYELYRYRFVNGRECSEYVGRKDAPAGYATYPYSITDYTTKNHTEYTYEVVVRNKSTHEYLGCIELCSVESNFDGWYICSLSPVTVESYGRTIDKAMNRYVYTVGEEWNFISAINSGDITRNINAALHVGVSAYAKTSRDNTKYESGSFTADLLTVECPSGQIKDDIERVDKWMKFISGDNPFLLKSAKGDVWVVNIINSPSRRYDETLNPIFTNVTYEWAESRNAGEIVIGGTNEFE